MTAEKWATVIAVIVLVPVIVVLSVIALALACGYVMVIAIWNLLQLCIGAPGLPFMSPSVPVRK